MHVKLERIEQVIELFHVSQIRCGDIVRANNNKINLSKCWLIMLSDITRRSSNHLNIIIKYSETAPSVNAQTKCLSINARHGRAQRY